MERRLNNKISGYLTAFKNDMKAKIMEEGLSAETCNRLLVYMYDYDGMVFTQDDFVKRKRVKNTVPVIDRCCAKRANDEQCTRRKKEGFEYCGTHVKGTPNGLMTTESSSTAMEINKVEVWVQDIMGISYYLDNQGNVYEAEDVVMNRDKPKIIAQYHKLADGKYSIPEFGIH